MVFFFSKVTKKVFNQPGNVVISTASDGTQPSPEPSNTSTNETTTSSSSGSGCVFNQPGPRPSEKSTNEPTTSYVSGSGNSVDQPEPGRETDSGDSSSSRKATLELISQRSIPYDIPTETLLMIDRLDSCSVLGVAGQESWPSEFAPEEGMCGRCGSLLGTMRSHPGSKGEKRGKAYLITKLNPFRMVTIHVRYCTSCKAMHQANALKTGKVRH